MKLIQLFENLIDIRPEDIKIENGIMIQKQFPNKVNTFNCENLTNLTSLENCPQNIINFDCNRCIITSLQYAPSIISGNFDCRNTKITSLEYAPLKCFYFNFSETKVTSLQGIGRKYLKECERLILSRYVESNILGICKISKLTPIFLKVNDARHIKIIFGPLYEALEIVGRHLQTDGDECREELIQNGFKDYARF